MARRKRIGPEDTVPLRLSRDEQRLLCDELIASGELTDKIRVAEVQDEGVVVYLTLSEADELADAVAAAANHARTRKRERELDRAYGRVVELLDTYTDQDEEPASALHPLAAALTALFPDGAQRLGLDIGGELQILAQAAELLRQELGGLSLPEAVHLCASPWEAPEGFVHLNEELSLEELQGADILAHARQLLRAILDAGGVKATVAGNLNRRFVDSMLGALRGQEADGDFLRRRCKVVNEQDFWPLHIVRIVTGLARLLRRTKGVFHVTKRGQALLADDRAGALYALLFRTYFRRFNLAYGSYLPRLDWLQATVGFSFFMLGKHAREWVSREELAPLLVSPMAKFELEGEWPAPPGTGWPVGWRIIDPLELFGLLERRRLPAEEPWERPSEVRVTELFDRFLRFDMPEPQRPTLLPGTH